MSNAILVPGRPDKEEHYDPKRSSNSEDHWFSWLKRQLILKDIHAVTIDCIAALPTLYKAYVHPETEVYLQWILAAVAGFFSMLAVGTSTDYVLYIYPLYIVIMNGLIVLAKFAGSRKKVTA